MTDFSIPPGDPGSLDKAAGTVSSSASTIGSNRRSSLNTASNHAGAALPRMRVADFSAASSTTTKTIDTVAMSLGTVSGALSAYASALKSAQDTIRQAGTDYRSAHTSWLTAKHAGEDDLAQSYARQMQQHETTADNARRDLKTSEDSVASILSGEIGVWVPGGADSPLHAWQAASAGILPQEIRLDPEQLKEAYQSLKLPKQAVSNAAKIGSKGWQAWKLLGYFRAVPIAAKAEEEFAKAKLDYQLIKNFAPDLSDKSVYSSYIKAEKALLDAFSKNWSADAIKAQREFGFLRGLVGDTKAMERLKTLYPGLSETEITGTVGRFARLMGPVRAVSPWLNRVLAPLAIVTGGLDIYSGITDTSAPADIRWARGIGGLGSVAAGGATLLVMAGLLSNPVGWGIIIGGSAVAVGAWAYQNREAIWNGMKWTGGKIAAGAEAAGHGIATGAEAVGHGLEDAGGAIADGAGKVWHGIFG